MKRWHKWTLGGAGLAVLIGVGLLFTLFYRPRPERIATMEAVRDTLVDLAGAEYDYQDKSGGRFGSLAELQAAKLCDPKLGTAATPVPGYSFVFETTATSFKITAKPDKGAGESYYTDQTGVVYHADGRPVDSRSYR